MNGNIFQYIQDKKGKPIPLKYKLLYNIPLTQDELIYNGNLILYDSKITSLPNNLIVNGNLSLCGCHIEELPEKLVIRGNLILSNSEIKSLPDNLTVNSILDIGCTSQITLLPNDLIINGDLDISCTQISKLPNDLIVTGNLYCYKTPLADNIKNDRTLLEKYHKQVKGRIFYYVCNF